MFTFAIGSQKGKEFQLRFRVPFALFLIVLAWTQSWYCFDAVHNPNGVKEFDAFGVKQVPTDLLVMGVLRILGRSTCLDGIEELSYISKTKMGTFFHMFTSQARTLLGTFWFISYIFFKFFHLWYWLTYFNTQTGPVWIVIPESNEEIAHTINSYAHIGLPGCISSFDVVHVAWSCTTTK